jgi:hypothetical protein
MRDYATAAGALAFIIGILMIGISGNQKSKFRSHVKALLFSLGAVLMLAGFGAEAAGVVSNMGGSSSASSGGSGSSAG